MSCYSAGDGAGHEAVAAEVCPGEKLLRGQWWWWPSVQPPPPPLPGTQWASMSSTPPGQSTAAISVQ